MMRSPERLVALVSVALLAQGCESAPETSGQPPDAGPVDAGPADADVALDVASADVGSPDTGPWTPTTCPPRRAISQAFCEDPTTSCVCASRPETCSPGWLCLGGKCFSPGQRRPEECEAAVPMADFSLDLSALPEGKTSYRGVVEVNERPEGGWIIALPLEIEGVLPPILSLSGPSDDLVELPFRSGETLRWSVCRNRRGPQVSGETLRISRGEDDLLFVGINSAPLPEADEECYPSAFHVELEAVNCPPRPEGDDPDRSCEVCRPLAITFKRGGGGAVMAGALGYQRLDGKHYQAIAGAGLFACTQTCCDETGSRPTPGIPSLDFALLFVPPAGE